MYARHHHFGRVMSGVGLGVYGWYFDPVFGEGHVQVKGPNYRETFFQTVNLKTVLEVTVQCFQPPLNHIFTSVPLIILT